MSKPYNSSDDATSKISVKNASKMLKKYVFEINEYVPLNTLSGRRQAIICTNAGILLIWP